MVTVNQDVATAVACKHVNKLRSLKIRTETQLLMVEKTGVVDGLLVFEPGLGSPVQAQDPVCSGRIVTYQVESPSKCPSLL